MYAFVICVTDAVELLRALLDELHEELKMLSSVTDAPRSLIHRCFLGQFTSFVECQTCKTVTKRAENFFDISVSLPAAVLDEVATLSSTPTQTWPATPIPSAFSMASGQFGVAGANEFAPALVSQLLPEPKHIMLPPSAILPALPTSGRLPVASRTGSIGLRSATAAADLVSCLRDFFGIEQLDAYRCDACSAAGRGTHHAARKRFLIEDAPPILVLHIKRFCFTLDGSLRKVDAFCSFPLRLDVTPFCSSSRGPRAYVLRGIAVHVGRLNGGHYTAYVRSAEPPATQWHYFSDSRVRACDASEVLDRSAYVLFYEREG